MAKKKITPSDLYAELASMERIVENLREKISLMVDDPELKKIKKVHDDNMVSTIGGIGEELRKSREGRNWNIFYTSRKAGLRSETIQGLEEGKGTVKNLLKYCEALGIWLNISVDPDGKVCVRTFIDKL